MIHKLYLGIDNGVTASIGLVGDGIRAQWFTPPTKKEPNYHKKASNISRIDFPAWCDFLAQIKLKAAGISLELDGEVNYCQILAVLEKPFTGMATTAALSGRVYEAQLIGLEQLQIPYMTFPSTDWQGTLKRPGLLPTGTKGSSACKRASAAIGVRLFPHLSKEITKHGDADGLLIAEWARRSNL